MKFNELINENKKIDEAPMGLLKTAGHSMLKKVSPTSAGKLETGTTANQLAMDFKKYLGQTGEQPEAEVVLNFLRSRGLPTQGAETIIQSAGDEQPGALKTAAKAAAGDAVDAAVSGAKKLGGAMKSAAASGADKLKQAFAKKPAPEQPDQARQEPNMDEPAAPDNTQAASDNKQTNFSQGNYQQAKYSASAGFDPNTMQNVSKDMPAGSVGGIPNTNLPTAQPSTAKPAARKQGGGKVAGQLSQTPGAIRKRTKRQSGKTGSAISQFAKTQTGENPIRMRAGESIEYHFDKLLESLDRTYVSEALSKSVLDKIFLAAAQDAAKAGVSGGQAQSNAGAAQGGGDAGGAQGGQAQGGGFLSGFKQGFQGGGSGSDAGDGKLKGTVNVGQLAQLLQMDPRELSAALTKLKQGQGLSRTHVNTLSNAFISMYKADPQTTVRIANMLKRVNVDQG